MKCVRLAVFSILFIQSIQAQTNHKDTGVIMSGNLPDITVVGRNSKSDIQQMPEIVGTSIYAGRKSSLVVVDNVQGNVVTNTMRQVLSKVPGIHVWESDPSGIQIGIATRGLSPNRSWEFNVRQNGYDIAADPFGYPEAYYNPQLQGVQRIEIVRGQGSLQYGPQFGGMVNYILKNGSEINKPFEFETQQTLGSNGLFNSYNAIGGKKGKVHYYAFFDHRNGDGWRQNSRYFSNAAFGTVTYYMTSKFSATAEVMQSHTRSQQAGGLTDQQIVQDAQQSFRTRNWFDLTWTTPALILNYNFNETTRWNTKFFATLGDRNSVGYLSAITVKDSINPSTGTYNNRALTADRYRNYGMESRIITDYQLAGMKNTFSGGVRYYTGTTYRNANGKGTTGTDYDMSVIGQYPSDISFGSKNAAAFVESIFRINDNLLIIPGIRYEWLEGAAEGRNGFDGSGNPMLLQQITRSRSFLLKGIGAEYHIGKATEIYANYAEAYRPIQFANLQAAPTTDVVDENLKDAKGYSIDLGYRGKIGSFLQFDISSFYLLYKNRMGTIVPAGAAYRFITNVGNSTSKGMEAFVEFSPLKAIKTTSNANLSVFVSYSYTDARYSNDHKDASTKGKRVENAPMHILRTGITAGSPKILFTAQLSYVDEVYSDANNTVAPTSNGQNGLIPSYVVTDLSATAKISKSLNLKAGLNNLFDARYFTRRAGGYPGPGALPADGRTFFVSVGLKL
ncbi:MAG: TonB-dependent receptor [Sediminibacterium sp.]|nr:TonB-dependent receptor [Sediminibacterium sp.]